MTYIEFFDKTASENISACLTYAPERVIYIGDDSKLMKKHISNYEKVFSARGQAIEFSCKTVSKSNLDNVVTLLTELAETYDDCVFDITGGEEILNLALGIVYAKYPDKNIQIHKFNLRNNVIYDCDKDGNTVYRETPVLTVEENVRIYGGDVVYGDIYEGKTFLWDMNADFENDINLIWEVCKDDVRHWNSVSRMLAAIEAMGREISHTPPITAVKKSILEARLENSRIKCRLPNGITDCLMKKGLITRIDNPDGEDVILAYKNEQVKKCITKSGQALEMKIYLTAKNLVDKDGIPVYNDVKNGVVIDWDGELHDERVENEYDIENEIDILLMHDVVPVFISCKNGDVTADELYKLNTVAERFGGEYAKKVLVATSLSSMGESGMYIKQRAEDMNIKVLDDVQDIDDTELARRIKNLWCC